jgi:hypothetical protein
VILWSVPVGLMALVVGANVALAAGVARLLQGAGLAPGSGAGGIGFWALFFSSLALANGPALATFAAWTRAQERAWAVRAEVLSALRWPARLDRWRPELWPGVPAPGALPAPAPFAARTPLALHLPYAAWFVLALAGPVALIGLLGGS